MTDLFQKLFGAWVAKKWKANPRAIAIGMALGIVMAFWGTFTVLRTFGLSVSLRLPQETEHSAPETTSGMEIRAAEQKQETPADLDSTSPVNKAQSIAILKPEGGSSVTQTVQILGATKFPKLTYFVLVSSETESDICQDEPVVVGSDGSFEAEARIGNASVGAGQDFKVRVMATKLTAKSCPEGIPADAIFSSPITLHRL